MGPAKRKCIFWAIRFGAAFAIMLLVPTTPPTLEEFEEARRRELARLDLRISSITGHTYHTPEDSELLEGHTAEQRWSDMDVVRRWCANPARGTEGVKSAQGSTVIHRSS